MVKVVHSFNNLKSKKDVIDKVSFILANKKGSYAYFAENPESRYQGFFFFNDFKMYKIIENINLIDNNPINEIKNNFYSIERKRKKTIEKFFMPCSYNSIIYELNNDEEMEITLDVKESYDGRIWGRHYEISQENGCIIIKFTKRTDNKEDNSNGVEEYIIYLVIKSNNINSQKIEKWIKHYYKLDQQRNSTPFTRYVFNAIKLKGKKIVFSVSKSKKKAIKECNFIFNNTDTLKKKQEKIFNNNVINKNKKLFKKIKNVEKKFAYIAALNSLDNLIINNKKDYAILAGLPWFFQSWSRDTAISSKFLSFDIRKKILFNILDTLNKNGRVANIYNGIGGSFIVPPDNTADATGWIFYRLYELYKKNFLTKEEIKFVKNKLISSIKMSESGLTKEGFETNKDLETWMDTYYGNDTRSGIRIEIQALRLAMCKFAYELTNNTKYRDKELDLKSNVKEKFWNGKILADGLNDFTIRPNIFIAAHVYQELLTKKEWEKCFQNSLTSLWLDWGGLATIDKKNYLFCDYHTGENNKSYHRGDSWFWINNLAALVLYRTNKNKFKKFIDKILEASTNEILWKGALGNHSELSSANKLTSQGCLAQSWSNAMYIELINCIYL